MKFILFVSLLIVSMFCSAQNINTLIPTNTATHTAVQNGDWFTASTWDNGIPGDAAIVHIPSGITVDYEGSSSAHIFAIRVDGEFNCKQTNSGQTSAITFDTYTGIMGSMTRFQANGPTDGNINVTITPFDIEAHKNGTSGFAQVWNANALAHFSDGAPSYTVIREVGPDLRYNTYAEAIAGNTSVTEISRVLYDDGVGVTGRHDWDSTQLSIGIVVMGEIEILGQSKTNMVRLSSDALAGSTIIDLESTPQGWLANDEIIITRGGNLGASNNGEDQRTIQSIAGSQITLQSSLNKNHEGRVQDDLQCYVGNLTRNITFSSGMMNTVHHRAHFMAMHNATNIQVKNAAFIDMGRTDKSRLTDDFTWESWEEPVVFKSKISALGQECANLKLNPKEDITNTRGRYSIHLHKTGATFGSNIAEVIGNVVWGNPGWAITHHDSHADISENVIYEVIGAGLVSETGSETGFWNHNLIVDVSSGHSESPYVASLGFDDYLYTGQGMGMKGRAVQCNGNVIAKVTQGIGIVNFNASTANLDRVDPQALATVRPGFLVDNFPLDVNGYSIEGDGILPVEVALLIDSTTVIWSNIGLKSIERDMGVNHESRSVFNGLNIWGTNQGLSITYQADYSFKDVFISGKNSTALGAYLWKHSHNHVFDGIKLVDLEYGITVSKLVESGSGELKTRNNGFTPWYFIDLELENVGEFYEIEKEDPLTVTIYDEHSDNPIHLSSSHISPREVTFTILDSSELVVDYATGDFRFEIDGVITDDLGSYDMGIKQAWSQGTLRLDYPERIYEFASESKFEEYLTANGVFIDDNGDYYFILKESLPNRLNWQYTTFDVRVKILNPPSTALYASAQSEPQVNFDPRNQIVSRTASVSQSSTNASVMYQTTAIDAGAQKSIDGNNNGRINAQIHQQGLVPVGSFSETNVETEPWYDLDLGEMKTIDFIDVWNTVELNGSAIETMSAHFTNFYVLVSDSSFAGLTLAEARNLADYEYFNTNPPERKYSLNDLDVNGRYVRIQAVGNTTMKLAEVEIIGRTYIDICADIQEGTDARTECAPFTWIDGNSYTADNNTASYILQNANGCDSIVNLDLTINTLNNSINVNETTITADNSNATYQWIDCDDNNSIIPGETSQSFNALENGNYAVVLIENGCTDTSQCIEVSTIGLNEDLSLNLTVYPIPFANELKVDFGGVISEGKLEVFDMYGRNVYTSALSNVESKTLILDLTKGTYALKLILEKQVFIKRIIAH